MTCDPTILSAYLDNELAPAARAQVEEHLSECSSCAAELESLRRLSNSFATYPYQDLTDVEVEHLHDVLDESVDAPIWRLAGTLGVIAASILIVATAWLVELPTHANRSNTATVARAPIAAPAPWEQAAMTLRVDAPAYSPDSPMPFESTQFADAQFADWMLRGLGPVTGGGIRP